MNVVVRLAGAADEEALAALDRATWSALSSPALPPGDSARFLGHGMRPEEVLVAVVDGEIAGYARLQRATTLPASDHVRAISGFAVAPAWQQRGVGRALLDATAREARAQGARRLTLRVLAPNEPARRLYESCGFVVEGVLRGEFRIEGADVDDVLMARDLDDEPRSGSDPGQTRV